VFGRTRIGRRNWRRKGDGRRRENNKSMVGMVVVVAVL
jgi:hypothetical protein